jgi:hypothetical protein
MERTSRFLLGLEALSVSLFLRFGAITTVNKGSLNINTAIARQLMRIARTLEAECCQVRRGSMGTGTNEDELSTRQVWVVGFHHVTARSRLTRVLKFVKRLYL